ncbi:DUF572 domain-containing protein [Dokdonia sinensis]|nr:DUF572 domain-containing protein [Dokdonia sinensis]
MRIFGICKSCKNYLYLETSFKTKERLSSSVNTPIFIKCQRCGVSNHFEVQKLRAKYSRTPFKIARTALLSLTPLILASFFFLPYDLALVGLSIFLTAIGFLFIILKKLELNRISKFNG